MSDALQPEDNVAPELTFRKLFSRLWPFMRQYPGSLWAVSLMLLIFISSGRALPFLVGYAVDYGLKLKEFQPVIYAAVAYAFFEILRAGLAFQVSYRMQTLGNNVLLEIRKKLTEHVQSLPLSFLDRTPSGRILTRMTNDVFALTELFSQGFASIFLNVLEFLSTLVALVLISPSLTFLAMLATPVMLHLCLKLSNRVRVEFGAAKRKLSYLNAYTAESLTGIRVLQLFDQTKHSSGHFAEHSAEYRHYQLKTVRLFATMWPIVEGFKVFSTATALGVGAYFVSQGSLSVGALSAFVLLIQSFFKPLRLILEKYNMLQNSLASADRIFELMEEPGESPFGSHWIEKTRGQIEFDHVKFRYGDHLPNALDDVSFHIKPSQSVALVGRTGSGKTTIISLLQKFYTPQSGVIRIDGLDLNNIALADIRHRVGVIQQDPFLFRGTLEENITLRNPEITKEQVMRALERAHLVDIVQHWPEGLKTFIEERGQNLSAGERQLVAFARILAFDPDILILDEATANVDSISELKIQQAIMELKKNRTCLIIAHRLSTIRHCDRIFVMGHAKLLEEGSHEELLARRGHYYTLHQKSDAQVPGTL